ncbi:DUF3108 domain-containing protein [Maricaulis sp.]|uniref:DUF3108 domain-containing protein n=1 Tax=Maricaulis sp. TaxID=1486257 RepID=UPI002606EC79|nr:DUF3108 domain-containing protein [Maricaulis sp.]
MSTLPGASLLVLTLLASSPLEGGADYATYAAPDSEVAPVEEQTVISARYDGWVLVFKVGEIELNARFDANAYAADSFVRAAGLAALFTDFDIRSEVEGHIEGDSATPLRYAHVERTGDKIRAVDVSFRDAVAVSDVEPPFGSWGVPPASATDRSGVIDPMSAFFTLSETLTGRGAGAGCHGQIPVFDGKARYNLNLEPAGREQVRTRAWSGEALVCHAYYEPISGYDPEDYPSERDTRLPLEIWLASFDDGAFHLPVRLHTRAGFGGVTIEAREIRLGPATN